MQVVKSGLIRNVLTVLRHGEEEVCPRRRRNQMEETGRISLEPNDCRSIYRHPRETHGAATFNRTCPHDGIQFPICGEDVIQDGIILQLARRIDPVAIGFIQGWQIVVCDYGPHFFRQLKLELMAAGLAKSTFKMRAAIYIAGDFP